MARLTHLEPRTTFAPDRRAFPTDQAKGPPPVQHSQPWKAWYKTARWRRLREQVLIRDAYTCRSCGRVLAGKSPEPDSPVVDHIQAHRGNEALFWSEANLQAICKSPCHDQRKQAEEQGSLHHRGIWD